MSKSKRPTAYDAETWKRFTETERQELIKLYELRDAKFDELCHWLSTKLGVSDANLIIDEAEQAIDRWEKEAVMNNLDTPQTPFQRLLQEHHELGEAMLDIQDEACVPSMGE
jgi:hypothetical protein